MKLIPSVLFLTFAGFLPNECAALFNGDKIGQPYLLPEESGTIEVITEGDLSFTDELRIDASGHNEPDYLTERQIITFEKYKACLRSFPNMLHKSGYLFSLRAFEEGYLEPNYIPRSVKVMALNVEYDEFEEQWQEYNLENPPPGPLSKEFARLYITIPKTKKVYHKLLKEKPASRGVDYDVVRNTALVKIHDNILAQRTHLLSTLHHHHH